MTLFPGDFASPRSCGACRNGEAQPVPFSMAFQPIVDVTSHTVFAYEALVRGPEGQSAYSVLSQLTEENKYSFDQGCRVAAIRLASKLGLAQTGALLSINFLPGAVYSPAACIRKTLQTATECDFPFTSLIFELTEVEKVRDTGHLKAIVTEYRKHGFTLALDDFGEGYSGLNMLAELDLQELKLDGRLIRDINDNARKRHIVRATTELCRELGVTVIAEQVETVQEYEALRECGISLMQGYLFAKPMFEGLPEVKWPPAEDPEFHPLPDLPHVSTTANAMRH